MNNFNIYSRRTFLSRSAKVGMAVALSTLVDVPFVMKRALAAHLAFLRKSGVHGVLALGSTGEFIRMNLTQRQEVLESVAEHALRQ